MEYKDLINIFIFSHICTVIIIKVYQKLEIMGKYIVHKSQKTFFCKNFQILPILKYWKLTKNTKYL